jgi:CubicO group peptidase (beta-lactamase class C family)
VTKLVTCTAALQLMERGDFLMFQPVSEFIPEFGKLNVAVRGLGGDAVIVPAVRAMTIRDLFNMSGGMDYNLNSNAIQRTRAATDGRCPTLETVRAMAGEPLLFEPGTRWFYSLCHDVLAALVEVISGKKFSEYVQEIILNPLEMGDTYFHIPAEKLPRMAKQYRFDVETRRYEPKEGNDYIFGTDYESGGAGLISTVNDYMRFADALCNFGVGATGARILSESAVRLMRRNFLTPQTQPDFNWPQQAGYGYGLGVRTLLNPAAQGTLSAGGEFGWSGAAGAYVIIDPENELTVYYAQHMLQSQEEYIHPRLRNAVYADLF